FPPIPFLSHAKSDDGGGDSCGARVTRHPSPANAAHVSGGQRWCAVRRQSHLLAACLRCANSLTSTSHPRRRATDGPCVEPPTTASSPPPRCPAVPANALWHEVWAWAISTIAVDVCRPDSVLTSFLLQFIR
ncbi:Os07g0648566, partial [Oryza sativa Japonica Group]